MEIEIRSRFYGWRAVDYATAIDWAKFLFKNVGNSQKNRNVDLEYVNSRIRGIKFKIEDLQ